MTALPHIAILLATFNGAVFLDQQLASLAAQSGVGRIDLEVSDDGSSDDTLTLLANWRGRWDRGSFTIATGPGRGFAENFRALATSHAGDADYVAFSDQDDVWDADKLAVAVADLAGCAARRPGLYMSRTRLITADGRVLGMSPLFRRPPDFRNAIVQSIGGGNTIVLNRAGFALVAESARRTPFVAHDWWCYLIVSGAGGLVRYDANPHIGYRQHGANAVGSNAGWRARVVRFRQMLRGRLAGWTSRNLVALDACADLLDDEAIRTLAELRGIRQAPFPGNLRRFRRSGIHRQTLPGNFALAVAVMIGKL